MRLIVTASLDHSSYSLPALRRVSNAGFSNSACIINTSTKGAPVGEIDAHGLWLPLTIPMRYLAQLWQDAQGRVRLRRQAQSPRKVGSYSLPDVLIRHDSRGHLDSRGRVQIRN